MRTLVPGGVPRLEALARVALAASLLVACAPTRVPPFGEPGVTTEFLEDDERFLWKLSRESQQQLDRSVLVSENSQLDVYLEGVAQRLAGDLYREVGIEPHVRVLRAVDFNAFTFANGAMYIHSALLCRLESEAQLATLMSHELQHAIGRHSLRGFRDEKNKQAAVAGSLSLTGGLLGALAPALQWGVISSIYGYSRDLEREADAAGFRRARAAGYDVRDGLRVFEILRDQALEAEAHGASLPEQPYYYQSHPGIEERIASYRALLAAEAPAQAEVAFVGREEFSSQIDGLLTEQAALELDANQPWSARPLAQRSLERNGRRAGALVVLADALLAEDRATQQAAALELYREATVVEPEAAAGHRALATFLYRSRSDAASLALAITHFERVLELAPGSVDRRYVEAYLLELRAKQTPGSEQGAEQEAGQTAGQGGGEP